MKEKNTINYIKSLDFLNNLPKFSGSPSLCNIKKTLENMNNFQNELNVIHITGTNGKGSTLKFLENSYINAGYKVGAFTSPHILRVNEICRINGMEISDNDFSLCLFEIKKISESLNLQLSQFEMLSVISFLEMHKKNVDIALVEVGIGSPFDSSNVFAKKTTVFTRIDLDHQSLLGNTKEEIAKTKSQIISANSKVILGENQESIINILKDKADELKCQTYLSNSESNLFEEGDYQNENAKTALSTLRALQNDLPVNVAKARRIISSSSVPLRLEWIKDYILIDSAHNISGIKALEKSIVNKKEQRKIICIFGVLEDKDYKKMLKVVQDFSDEVILTLPINERARSFDSEDTCGDTCEDTCGDNFISEYKKAIDFALKKRTNEIIVISGSFYLTAYAKKYILELKE